MSLAKITKERISTVTVLQDAAQEKVALPTKKRAQDKAELRPRGATVKISVSLLDLPPMATPPLHNLPLLLCRRPRHIPTMPS